MKAGGGREPEGNANVDDDEEEEAATGKPVLELSIGLYRQNIHTYLHADTHNHAQTHPREPGKCVHVYFVLKHCDSHIHTDKHTHVHTLLPR